MRIALEPYFALDLSELQSEVIYEFKIHKYHPEAILEIRFEPLRTRVQTTLSLDQPLVPGSILTSYRIDSISQKSI